jgi:TetR/AcrR family transcriptional regulator of autoinduction and epiphytic fitness
MSSARAPEQELEQDGDAGLDTDGRRLRRQRNRDAVVDALAGLYSDGNLRPSSAEIAERAGLSPRSLFRYFDDVDDLCRAAVDRLQEQALPLLAVAATADDPLTTRVEALVDQRLRLWRNVAPAATVSRLEAPFHPALADGLRRSRAVLRAELATLFGPELDAMEPEDAEQVLAALDVVCSFESFELLRHDQALAVPRLRAALVHAVTALLGRPPSTPPA